MQEYFQSNPFFYSLALTLIHFLWQGLLVAFALKTALTFTPYRKPQLRYLFSSFAMLLCLALPFITFLLIHQPEALPNANLVNFSPLLDFNSTNFANNASPWTSDFIEFLPYLSVLWLAAVLLLASKLMIEMFMVNQLPKHGIVPTSPQLAERFSVLVEQIQLKKAPRLLISLKTEVPMAIGWLKPVVLLPASMICGLSSNQLEMLILHELAHIRRHDYLVNFLQTLVSILLFFHPAVQWISKQMRNEREYCSDDIAVQHCGDAIAYAHTLADTASLCHKHRHHTIPNMAMAASGGDLKQRVVRLVGHHCSSNNEVGKWLAATLTIVLVLGLSSQQLLSSAFFEVGSKVLTFQQANNKDIPTLFSPSITATSSIAKHLLATQLHQQQTTAFPFKPAQQILASNKSSTVKTPLQQLSTTSSAAQISRLLEQNITADIKVSPSAKNSMPKVPTALQQNKKIAKPLVATTQSSFNKLDPNLANPPTKSLSNLAFERTNSNSRTFGLSNPYAKQVAALTTNANFFQQSFSQDSKNVLNNESDVYALENNLFAPAVNHSLVRRHKPVTTVYTPIKNKAKLIRAVDPKYPTTAKRRGIEIEVKVNFTIDASGRVKNIIFEQQSKVNYFRNSIRSAMQKWSFDPARIDGKAIESTMSKIFSFSLQG